MRRVVRQTICSDGSSARRRTSKERLTRVSQTGGRSADRTATPDTSASVDERPLAGCQLQPHRLAFWTYSARGGTAAPGLVTDDQDLRELVSASINPNLGHMRRCGWVHSLDGPHEIIWRAGCRRQGRRQPRGSGLTRGATIRCWHCGGRLRGSDARGLSTASVTTAGRQGNDQHSRPDTPVRVHQFARLNRLPACHATPSASVWALKSERLMYIA